MKKIYNAPLTEVVKFNTEQMICQSLQVQGSFNSSTMSISGKEDEYIDDNEYFDGNLW